MQTPRFRGTSWKDNVILNVNISMNASDLRCENVLTKWLTLNVTTLLPGTKTDSLYPTPRYCKCDIAWAHTRLTQLVALHPRQPFVEDTAEDCWKEEDWTADGRVVGCDQRIGHKGDAAPGGVAITWWRGALQQRNSHITLQSSLSSLCRTVTRNQLHTNPSAVSQLHFFYDWINTKIKSITQLSKPSLKDQNNSSDLHHYKHMSTSHCVQQVICKTLNTLVYIRHRSISRGHFLAIPKHWLSNYHTYEPVK